MQHLYLNKPISIYPKINKSQNPQVLTPPLLGLTYIGIGNPKYLDMLSRMIGRHHDDIDETLKQVIQE
jgi:hypothetical protein